MIKKYFSLEEISKILNQPSYKIRYLEKSQKIDFFKLNNRSYFNVEDIKSLSIILNNKKISSDEIIFSAWKVKIDNLIKKFRKLL
ncbi:MAG: hypothetical protein ISN64_04320 [Rickettsia sp.]|nr:hypothetical protein [Rickettsia sp.]